MKRLLYFVVFLLVALCGQSQTINQKGVTYRYNGKNKRTPIGGVYIKPVTANNGVVSDEGNGTFTLVLNSLQMGSRIGNVRVTKQGMMVFNQQAVDEWSVRKDPLCLILCDANEFQKQKKNLIAIGESQAKKKYDKKLAELERQNNAKQLKIDEYYNQLESLEKEYQNALKHMDEYADVFARIDESEVDTITQRAIDMFHRGEIEESIHLLEQQNYMEKINQANRTIEQADAMISTVEQAKSLAEKDKEKYIQGAKTQIAGYKLQNEWDKAKKLLKGLADNLNSMYAIWDYASFCHSQNDFIEAEIYYHKYNKLLNVLNDIDETEILVFKQKCMNNMALLYKNTRRYTESELMYKSALNYSKRLATVSPILSEHLVAITMSNLANLYNETERYSESETMFISLLEIVERLAESDPAAFESDLAKIYGNLALLYKNTNRFDESEAFFKCSLDIFQRLSQFNSSIFEYECAITQYNLAILYNETQRYAESEVMFRDALEIINHLAELNPFAYRPNLALIQKDFAKLCYNVRRYSKSEKMYKLSLEIYEHLSKYNPSLYEPNYAEVQQNLAKLFYETKRYAESEVMYKSSLEIYKRISKSISSVYELDLANVTNYLALLYKNTQRYGECEEMYISLLDILDNLSKSDSLIIIEPKIAKVRHNLAKLYYTIQRYEDSETMYRSALEIYERLANSDPLSFEPDLAVIQYNLAILYDTTQCFTECISMYKKTITTYLQLYEKEPSNYDKDLADCYYRLGNAFISKDRYHEAVEPLVKSLNLSRKIVQTGKDDKYVIYQESLCSLFSISLHVKDYVSLYAYNDELLMILKNNYEGDMNKWKEDFTNQLISQSYYANLLGKFKEGEQKSLDALKVDSTKHIIFANLAAALLFQGKVEEAENLYRQYKAEFKDGFLDDFAEFERLNVIPEERKKDVERIKAMLKE